MRRGVVVIVLVALAASGCSGEPDRRTVRVDFAHDEFASHYWRYFPRTVYARPGDQVAFEQEWTGEPHTVTFGTIVDRAVPRIEAVEKKYERNPPETEEEISAAVKEFEEASMGLPVFDPYTDLDSRDAIDPCYLDRGVPPQKPQTRAAQTTEPCRRRPERPFDGKQAYYSSGFIPPSGPEGNTYLMSLADDIEPGTYSFYCVIHYPEMQGRLVVKAPDEEIPTQSEMNKQALEEIDELATPLRRAFADARAGRARGPHDQPLELPIAGYHAGDEYTVAIDEFVPKLWRVRVNEPVTWTITGAHTISFNVPEFVPIYRTGRDGTLERNPVVDRAAGGSPDAPPVDFTQGPVEIDGGTWDGSGFISSGLLGSEPVSRYTLRVSKPGRYRYACLVHPAMVADLEVAA